jgi:hypothetical protein
MNSLNRISIQIPVTIFSAFPIQNKAQKPSYVVAEIVAKKRDEITISEPVILPACCKIVNIMFGEEYAKEILKFLMSDNSIY